MAISLTRKNPLEDEQVIKLAQEKAALEASKPADWSGGTYGQSLKDTLNKINNREKFTYDLNADMLYNQYKDQYINAGKLAMADTMGQAAALTGGYGNSYAATVGNQAYQSYLQQLNNKVPELYQLAYNRYNQEGQDLKDKYSLYGDMYNREYAENQDAYNKWNADRSRADSLYAAALDYATNEANTAYNNAYNLAQYNEQMAYQKERDAIADEQWNKNYALQQQSAAASRAASNQSAKIAELQGQLGYYQALAELGGGIEYKQVTRGNRGNTGNGSYYTALGKSFNTRKEAEDAVAKYLDKLNLSNEQILDIYAKLGIGTK